MRTVTEDGESADWAKKSWDLPPYKSPDFMEQFPDLAQFRTLPVYKNAVEQGLIVNDRWAGPITDEENIDAFAREFQQELAASSVVDEPDDTEYNAAEDLAAEENNGE